MHILLADDRRLVRDGLKGFLARLASDVTILEAETFDDALTQATDAEKLDLILLDLAVPGMNGLAGLEIMRAKLPEVPVVILSNSCDRRQVFNALDRGAHGFIPMSVSGETMLHALELVISGERYVPSVIISGEEAMPARLREHAAPYTADSPLERLTRRERDVLKVLLHGYSNKQIAHELGLQEVTVKVHLKGVFRKLGAANRTQAVKTAMELGWHA